MSSETPAYYDRSGVRVVPTPDLSPEEAARVDGENSLEHLHHAIEDVDEFATPGHLHHWHGVGSIVAGDLGDDDLRSEHRRMHSTRPAEPTSEHALVRRPGPIDRRWEGDARPPAPQTAVALLGEHRHGTPPGGVLACQPSWHATCRNCRKPIALCFESGGHPIWLHDNPYPGAPYSRCLPATYAEPMPVVTEAVGQHTTDEEGR